MPKIVLPIIFTVLTLTILATKVARADDDDQPTGAPAAIGAQPAADKSHYTLFNPTPRNLLREFNPHRPGKSNSSTTIDAGVVQLESDFVSVTRDPLNSVHPRTHSYTIAAPNLFIGVTNWMEVSLTTSVFNEQSQFDGTVKTKAHGFGDSSLGLNINLFGNEGGNALSLVPSVQFPTAARKLGNGHAEYSLAVPFTTALPGSGALTLEGDFGVVRNDANTSYIETYGALASVTYPTPIKNLGVLVEVAGAVTSDHQHKTVSFDPALTYLVAQDLQLDVGAYLGLTKYTPKTIVYTGFTKRF